MTTEEFNELPLDARQYIERQKTCLSCGKSNDLDAHYKNFLIMKNKDLYTLRTGAVNYKDSKGKGGILYPIHPNDGEKEIKGKLEIALKVHASAPEKFDNFSEEKIKKELGLKTEAVKAPLTGAAKAAADKKAEADAKAAAENQTTKTETETEDENLD